MKLKKVKIIVESIDKIKKRWINPLKKKSSSKVNEEVISVGSWEILGKVLSPPRLQILAGILQLKPKSIAQLAKALKKDFKNVYSDVQFLAELGLIELKEEKDHRGLIPIAKFQEIELPLAA